MSRSRMRMFRSMALVAGSAVFGVASATTTVNLPAASCTTDVLTHDGFETTTPGAATSVTRTVTVPGVGTFPYYLRLPADFASSGRAFPVVMALHGSGGPGTSPANAQATRNAWAPVADANQFIVVAPASNGSQGGWGVSADFPMLAAIIDALGAEYRLDRSRLYLWGFSAGGHFGHGLALENTGVFAAYGVSAGVLYAYACDPSGAFACSTYLPTVSRKIPVDIHIGTSDPLFANASGDDDRFLAAGWPPADVQYVQFAGGHTYDATHLAQVWQHLCKYAIAP